MKKILLSLLFIFPLTVMAGADNTISADEFKKSIPHDNTECATAVMSDALETIAPGVDENAPESEIQEWAYTIFNDAAVLFDVLQCDEIKNAPADKTIRFKPITYIFPNGREIAIDYQTQPRIIEQHMKLAEKRSIDRFTPNGGGWDENAVWTNMNPAWYGIMITQHGAFDQFIGPGKDHLVSAQYIYDNIEKLYPNGADNGGQCTARSALAYDNLAINVATARAVNAEDDSNDYYIAGDIDLGWIMYAEIAADIAMAVVTLGSSALIQGGTKIARMMRVIKTSKKTLDAIKAANKVDDIGKLLKRADTIKDFLTKAEKATNVNDIKKILKNMKNADNADDIADIEKLITKNDKIPDAMKTLRKQADKLDADYAKGLQALNIINEAEKQVDAFKSARKALNNIDDTLKALEKTDDVKDYIKYTDRAKDAQKRLDDATDAVKAAQKQVDDLAKIPNKTKEQKRLFNKAKDAKRHAEKAEKSAKQSLDYHQKALKRVENAESVTQYRQTLDRSDSLRAELDKFQFFNRLGHSGPRQTGNILARGLRAFKGLNTALWRTNNFNNLQRAARAGTFSGRARDWLFYSSMKAIGSTGKVIRDATMWYGIMKFAGDMYDQTSDSTGAYTNNIEFHPYLLLSADDIKNQAEDQSNVVNYGMWLMWVGDSMSAADDDAAFLQAMDFAERVHTELLATQNGGSYPCNVDIFVVRPVIKNPGSDNQQIYHLIMNDRPWTTAQ